MGTARTTLAMAKASRIPEDALNIKPTDSRFLSYLNEATDRLLKRGKFWGTYGKYAISVTSQMFSLPPYLDTVEKCAVSKVVLPLRDSLYEFLEYGWGIRDTTSPNGSGVWEALYQGSFPTMVDITSPGGVLTLKCDIADDVGKLVLVLGYDTSSPPNWIRTQVGGVWQDGELVALSQGAGTNSVNQFGRIVGVQPQSALSGQWWIYQGGVTGTLLSNYQYFETSPIYKRYQIPFVNSTITTVDIIGKLAFIPVANDSDYLVIGNIPALKLACMACKAEAEHNFVEANLLWNGGTNEKTGEVRMGAITELQYELSHHLGDGREIGINVTGSGYGNDEVIPLW